MKLKRAYLFSFLLLITISINGKDSHGIISFSSDTEVSVKIYQPIDGVYNDLIVSDEIILKPNINIEYSVPMNDFGYVLCKYSNESRCNIPLLEGDRLKVQYNQGNLLFIGDNSEGIAFFNNQFFNRGTLVYKLAVDSIFDKYVDKSITLPMLFDGLRKKSKEIYAEPLNRYKAEGKVQMGFWEILKINLDYFYYSSVCEDFGILLSGKKKIPYVDDKTEITDSLNSIYLRMSPFDKSLLKTNYGGSFLNTYLKKSYNELDDKQNFRGNDSEETFGPYGRFILAPNYMQSILFANAFIIQYQYMVNEFDKDKMFSFLKTNFPDSGYIPILQKLIDEHTIKKEDDTIMKELVFVEDTINALEDLVQVESIKGNHIFIDLWATWCVPCKMEFQHTKALKDLLSKFDDIVPVYISIDEDTFEKLWRKNVEQYNLIGYHIRASKAFMAHFKKALYGGGAISIPRYLVLDKEGKILNGDLPRPSQLNKLEEALNNVLSH